MVHVLDVFWMFYVGSIYVLCLRGSLNGSWYKVITVKEYSQVE